MKEEEMAVLNLRLMPEIDEAMRKGLQRRGDVRDRIATALTLPPLPIKSLSAALGKDLTEKPLKPRYVDARFTSIQIPRSYLEKITDLAEALSMSRNHLVNCILHHKFVKNA